MKRFDRMTSLPESLGATIDHTGHLTIGNPDDATLKCWYCGAPPSKISSAEGNGVTFWHSPTTCCDDKIRQRQIGKFKMKPRIDELRRERE